MTCKLIDGKAISDVIRKEIAANVAEFRTKTNLQPRLGVLLVGNDPASRIYVKKKQQACEEVGIASHVVEMPNFERYHKPQHYVEDQLIFLNINSDISGILVQLPLPPELNTQRIFSTINPLKDVDVFNPLNVGLLVQGRPRFKPCTPHGIQQMLFRSGIPIAGQHVVVINRSNVVGKPLSSMLIQEDEDFANATVTVCHNLTPPMTLARLTRQADIVVVAVGIPDFLKGEMIRPGAVVVDVGINRVNGKVVGDCHASCRETAGWVSPVPNGVGPVTCTMLLENTLLAAKMLSGLL